MTIILDDGASVFTSLEEFTADMSARFGCDEDEVPVVVAETPGVGVVLDALFEHESGIFEKHATLIDHIETQGRDPLASETRRLGVLGERFERSHRFFEQVMSHLERNKAERRSTERQRQPFNHIIRGGKMQTDLQGLESFIRHGGQPYFDVPLERRDLLKATSTGGAELVPTSFSPVFFEALRAQGAVRQTNAQQITTSGGENLLVPKTTGFGTATIIAEGGPILESDPTFARVTLGSFKYGQLIQVSRELIEDAAVDVVSYVARMLGESIGQLQGSHFVTGTGTGQPQGIANSPTVGVTLATGQTTTITSADSLIDLFFSVLAPYRVDAFWVMNDLTLALVRKLKASGTGEYVVDIGLGDPQPRILGHPVLTDAFMATPAANAYTVAFGDFSKYYAIRDAGTLRVERSDDFAFANDLVTFRGLLRTDAKQVVNGSNAAVKFLRQSAT